MYVSASMIYKQLYVLQMTHFNRINNRPLVCLQNAVIANVRSLDNKELLQAVASTFATRITLNCSNLNMIKFIYFSETFTMYFNIMKVSSGREEKFSDSSCVETGFSW